MPRTVYAGLDTYAFPGLARMQWLKSNTNLCVTGFYLAPAPSHPDDSWMKNRAALWAMGWGFLPVFVGQELQGPGSHKVSAEQGGFDGGSAAHLMALAGFRPGSYVYLDLEDGAPFVEPRVSYVKAWAKTISDAGWGVGVYSTHGIASEVAQTLSEAGIQSARIWGVRVSTVKPTKLSGMRFPIMDPGGCGYADAIAWQHSQNVTIDCSTGTLVVDLNVSLVADPSAPVGVAAMAA